jgi:type I restriction enzyme, R subunit
LQRRTRFHLIDPLLRRKGYDDPQRIKLETPAPVEPIGPKDRRAQAAPTTCSACRWATCPSPWRMLSVG